MTTTRFSQGELDALTAAISTGMRRVTVDGKTVEYQDLPQMIQLRDRMVREMQVATDSVRPMCRPAVFVRD